MTDSVKLTDFPLLRLNHVYIKDKAAVAKIVNEILHGGTDNLQVVTDFDLTLTKQHVNGKQVLSSFGIFGKCKQLSEDYDKEAKKLYQKYRPIEIDPVLSTEEKIKAMSDWMIAAQNLLTGIQFDPKEINEVVELYGTDLRDGTTELIQKLFKAGVPILVFSAGLGDVVEAILKHHRVLLDNVKVVSNFLKYDGKKLNGFKNEKLIHTFNKNEYALEQNYFKKIKHRKNVILMGDTIGDASMVDGMDHTNAILRIGFLYDHATENLASYMDNFDIVLIDDQTMDVVSQILNPIL